MLLKNAYSEGKVFRALIRFRRSIDPKAVPEIARRSMNAREANSFLLGVMFDKGVLIDIAWRAGDIIDRILGDDEDPAVLWERLAAMEKRRLEKFLRYGNGGKAFHRFYRQYTDKLPLAAGVILDTYRGDPRLIWNGQRDVPLVEKRLKGIPLIGVALSKMAVRLLATAYGLLGGAAALEKIDIKPDIHVMRVFKRSGLVRTETDYADAIRTAQKLHPEFPGTLDMPAWEIGKTWCRPSNPKCSECPLSSVCRKAFRSM